MGKANKKGLAKKLAFKAEMKLKRKEMKKLKTAKRAKLIVRNLPFQTNEENLKKHFEQYGDVDEVTLLKKPDGKLVGCGFVRFKLVQKAAKARHHLNGNEFLGRNIEVDFAIPKDTYKKKIKKEKQEIESIEIKEESDNKVSDTSVIKIEDDDIVKMEDEDTEVNEEMMNKSSENESEDDDASESENEDGSESKDEEGSDNDDKSELKPKKPFVISNDVTEGKTVFIKNVPFSATNEDLKTCITQFGPVYYCLICFDKLTEHSKGTAFVKFKNQEDAEKCLQAGTELKLQGNILDCHKALSKDELKQKGDGKEDTKQHKDSRNLYLIKEGVIMAGTKAAENVSASDMAKRLQLEQYKTQMLRNLNMYISRYRLIIHNLPPNWDDVKLKALFKKFAGPKAVIREAKVMRNLRNIDRKGTGESKQYGFVTFTKHENALTALRALNNNPNVFSATKRPIVAFSIENKKMVKAKEKRLEKSRLNNPMCKDYKPSKPKDDKNKTEIKETNAEQSGGENERYMGVTARAGVRKMRNRFNLQTQARLHYENLKKEKKKLKFAKKTLAEKKKDFIRQPAQKMNKKKSQVADNFSQLVNDYKQKLMNVSATQKTKWYE